MAYKIMLLDDEPILLEGLVRQTDWEAHGFELVCTARNGFDGLEKFLDHQPDAILTDIRMRFMNGLDFIRQIHHINADVEIAVMSAFDVFEYAQQACNLGVTDYLLKPIADHKLSDVLNTMYQRLEKRRSIASRLERVDRYVREQDNAFQSIARKQLLLGNDNQENLLYAKLPELQPGEKMHLVMIQDNQEQDTHLLSIPVESMFVEQVSERVLIHCIFDNGTICAVLRSDGEDRTKERKLINDFLDAVRESMKENLTVTIGCDVDSWSEIAKSYRSAKKQMQLARMLGIIGVASLPSSEEGSRYPRQLEQRLLGIANGSTTEEIQKWSRSFLAWGESHPEQFVFAARGIFQKVLQRFVELDEISIAEYEQWRSGFESVLALSIKASIERFSELMEQLFNTPQKRSSVSGSYMSGVIDQIKTYVSDHLEDSSLNIRAAAEYMHVSAPYLGRLFKRFEGMSFNGYLNEVRLERARLLLFNNDLRIGEVAAAVGFENQSYFQVLFKKKNGMTPGDYRAQLTTTKGEPL